MFWGLVVVFVIGYLLWQSSRSDDLRRGTLYAQRDALIRECVLLGMPNPRGAEWAKLDHYWIGGKDRQSWEWINATLGHSEQGLEKSIEELQALLKCWQTEQEQRSHDRKARLLKLPTSTTQHLIGRRILKQIRMVRVDGCSTDVEADLDLREAALEAGAGAIINMRVRPYPGGKFSAEGDAVTLQDE